MKVVILCGGQGTRAYPYTKRIPKALMPVAGAPIVEQVMRIYAYHGYDQFILAVGYLKEDIARYFRRRREWCVECVDTGDTTDTGGRLKRCLDRVGERFHATYCDGLGDVDVRAVADFHTAHGGAGTVTAAPLRSQYGILHSDDEDRIVEFVEKPVLREYWINAGFFVFNRDEVASIDGENLERDILPELARRGQLRVYRHHGFWRSMDTHKDQQELHGLWLPHSEGLRTRLALGAASVPRWLDKRYAVA
ncbi:MAG TPA: sugar phosphate nucleotidyltransferase, partial [Candidatus Dormibacteraeota bacterium]|nr:sugar phosphate nucleotidyltransferase [Candidatus Dormibacteraeota bacterium]